MSRPPQVPVPQVRSAVPGDAAFAAPLIQETIGAIGHALTGEVDDAGAARVIEEAFARPGHRLSFEFTLLLEEDGVPLGLAVLYPGERAELLDRPFHDRLRALGRPDHIVAEARPGELYLDTLAVAGAARGRGLGATLLAACAARAQAAGRPLALLVEDGNPAGRLYRRLGFAGEEEVTVAGHRYLRLAWAAAPAADR
ncbi:GNAT family N-acetyltransferase [uncultured Deinococcus sp.]|uniref:GNAT family N-acetyltransferase n=1 Tax=uncultured Deinococcus sp. TaxID=158789 RepID=UPI00258D00F2|nr:GNAT family N-acetyltransferase [uncultured Deinococcus sp.]